MTFFYQNHLRSIVRVLLLLAFFSGCVEERAPGPWNAMDGYQWRSLNPHGSGGFTRLEAPRHGVQFRYEVSEDRRIQNRILAEGQGVALGDVDGDGLADLFFAGFGSTSALYLNRGDWHFEDITRDSGLDLDESLVRGAVLVDVDGDEALDLLVTVHGAPNRLFLGNGLGRFVEAKESGFSVGLGSTTSALADIDRDGDLDLYVANYKTKQVDDLYPPELLEMARLQRGSNGDLIIPPDVMDIYEEHYRVEFDGRFVRRFELGEPDELYLNEGEGRFRSVAFSDAFRVSETSSGVMAPRDWGLAARFSDWDGDGDVDLYVANDFNSPDGIWLNRGDGTFEEVDATSIRTTSLSSMAIDVGDIDRDGDLDLVTTDMMARDPARRLTQTPNFEQPPEAPGLINTRLQVNRNTVQLNRGDGTFAEVAWELGLAATDWTWGALLLDADLDGWEDLFVTTGHVWNQLDGDANQRIFSRQPPLSAAQALRSFPDLRQPNAVFRGGPGGRFEDVTKVWGLGTEPDISHGIASGDLDADGDLDLVVTRFSDPPLFYRNEATAPRVLVRLRGPLGNADGIGSRVRLIGHPAGEQIDEIVAGGTYLSSSEPAVTFAASIVEPMTLMVNWPDGRQSHIEGVQPNREYDIWHTSSEAISQHIEPKISHFTDVSDRIRHQHVAYPFDDRARQPMLPLSLSQLGPGVSWFDADNDGDPDLLIGSDRGASPALFTNEGENFSRPRAVTSDLNADATMILPHWSGSRGWELAIGLSAYKSDAREDTFAVPSVITTYLDRSIGDRTPKTIFTSQSNTGLPSSSAATGPLAQADVDGDGDVDMFVGGRVVPGLYPIPASSKLLFNDDGRLVFHEDASSPFADLGLVSAAVFTDVDLDGDPDLALAMEWGPIRLFRNHEGRFLEATTDVGLGVLTGRWNGISSGDFDEDGRPDLVATAWGANLEVPPAYSIFYGDFNRDGFFDVVEATRGVNGWLPVRGRDALARPTSDRAPRLPSLFRTTYEVFSTTPLEQLIGGLDTTSRHDLIELRHTVFLNRGDHFESAPLPREAQRAPAFGVGVGDLDGDSHDDLILAQNFYGGLPGSPRYDAGRGLWLRGNGDGGFTVPSSQNSGLDVYGDARGLALADFDLDGRVDVVIGVSGAAGRLFRNRGATPGFRVVLEGTPNNPKAIGAKLRIEYEDGSFGAVREVRSGAGYWSRNETPQTLGTRLGARILHIVWPGGSETTVPVPEPIPGLRSIRVRAGS